MTQREYWNKVAGQREFTVSVSVELAKKYLNANSRILDFGCGYGRVLEQFEKGGFSNLAGVDIAENMIKIARKDLPDVDFKINTGMEIPYGDSYFDGVIISAVLTCIPHSDDQNRLIAEIMRVLKPRGIVYICDFLINDDQRNINRYNQYQKNNGLYGVFETEDGAVLRHHTKDWIKELTSPFRELLFEETIFLTMGGHVSKGFCFIGRKDVIANGGS